MSDRDRYRGYGGPSGRYSENREFERGGYGGGDRYRGGREDWRDRSGGGDNDRGFLERAGDEIRSWFGDDDDRGGRDRDRHRDRGQGWSSFMTGGSDDHRDRGREPWGGGDRGPYGQRGESYRSGRDSVRDRFRGDQPHDDHYRDWRSQQLEALDRDYDEYRREHRERFHSEFGQWRTQRQQQRASIRQVKEHMDVVGSDGQSVGTVDKVSGDRIILTKSGAAAGGHHHSIPCGWLQSVDENRVTINKTAEQARQQWTDEENRRALFESEDNRRDDGPHILDRSFGGTYER